MTYRLEPKYTVGQKFTIKRKNYSRDYVITDIYTTFDSKGNFVKYRYVTTHKGPFDQDIVDYDIVETTIARALWNE